jgi:hypothetical protein
MRKKKTTTFAKIAVEIFTPTKMEYVLNVPTRLFFEKTATKTTKN